MKPKHIQMRIEQCLALARLSPCPRRKYGAVAIDPTSNIIISEGYNGGPRGGHELCGGRDFCRRDGVPTHDIATVPLAQTGPRRTVGLAVKPIGKEVAILNELGSPRAVEYATPFEVHGPFSSYEEAQACEKKLRRDPIPSGTRYEVGCHHSEANVVTNAARAGRCLSGAWLFVTGMPCLGCAKLIHHAGIVKVVTIRGGYAGENGASYLRENGVEIEEVDPPTGDGGKTGPFVDPGGR